MRGEIALIIAFVVVCAASEVPAVGDKVFTSSGQILPGEEWNIVSVYNDDTVVDMLGGLVDGMVSYDSSTVNVTGGYVSTLDTLEYSSADISGGHVHGSHAGGYSTVNFFETGTGVSLSARDFGTANMTGGTTEYARAGESGTLNLYAGLVTDSLNAWDSGTVNVLGYGLTKIDSGGTYGYGQVSGFWLDDTAFAIHFSTAETYSHVNLVPEPSSPALLALGSLLLRRKR
jgi:hypothetical protein